MAECDSHLSHVLTVSFFLATLSIGVSTCCHYILLLIGIYQQFPQLIFRDLFFVFVGVIVSFAWSPSQISDSFVCSSTVYVLETSIRLSVGLLYDTHPQLFVGAV